MDTPDTLDSGKKTIQPVTQGTATDAGNLPAPRSQQQLAFMNLVQSAGLKASDIVSLQGQQKQQAAQKQQQFASMPLDQQIRASWGGDWDAMGVDRAKELADLLGKQGVKSVGDISLIDNPINNPAMYVEGNPEVGNMVWQDASVTHQYQIKMGDKTLGYLGDYNNDNTFGNKASQYLNDTSSSSPLIGWSSRGHGNVGYSVNKNPETGKYEINANWGSSSDAESARKAAIVASVVVGGALAAGAGAGAGAAGEAAGAGAGAGGAAGGAATANAAAGAVNWGAVGSAAAKSAATNAILAAIKGGDASDIFKAAAIGGVSGGAGSAVSSGLGLTGGLGTAASGATAGAVSTAANGGGLADILKGAGLGAIPGGVNAAGITNPALAQLVSGLAKAKLTGTNPRVSLLASLLSNGNNTGSQALGAILAKALTQQPKHG